MNGRAPIVILAAGEPEHQAVRGRLAGVRDGGVVSGTRFEAGPLGDGRVVLAVAGPGAPATAVLAERAIRAFRPAAVLFAGVAGRLRPDLEPGDVVVATHVYACHGAVARAGGLASRPRVWEVSHALEQAARHVARQVFAPGAGPRVHFGPMASGEVLHDAAVSEPLSWLREHYDDALAIEMEPAAVARAGRLGAAPVGVIRAISDRADETGAAGAAAAFALALAADLLGRSGRHPAPVLPPPGLRVRAQAGSVNRGAHDAHDAPAHSDRGRC